MRVLISFALSVALSSSCGGGNEEQQSLVPGGPDAVDGPPTPGEESGGGGLDPNEERTAEIVDEEIAETIQTTGCSDVASCASVGVGHRPCGGVAGYRVYCSETTDVARLEALAAESTELQRASNEQSGMAGICVVASEPTLELVDGECRGQGGDLIE